MDSNRSKKREIPAVDENDIVSQTETASKHLKSNSFQGSSNDPVNMVQPCNNYKTLEELIKANDTGNSASDKGLSKLMLKKLEKSEKWLITRRLKIDRKSYRRKQKKLQAKLNNVQLEPSRKELKNSKMSARTCKISVVVDLSFDDLMDDRSIGKCNEQLLHSDSLNRRAAQPIQLFFTSFEGKSQKAIAKHEGYKNLDVHLKSEHFMEIFDSDKLIYLTSESDNKISSLEEDKVYIIGGLVDHNAYKGLCLGIAQEKGIKHGQLPISQFLDIKTRKVLTIDHVFEILLKVSQGATWKEACINVLPQRKGAKEKLEDTSDENTIKKSEVSEESPQL